MKYLKLMLMIHYLLVFIAITLFFNVITYALKPGDVEVDVTPQVVAVNVNESSKVFVRIRNNSLGDVIPFVKVFIFNKNPEIVSVEGLTKRLIKEIRPGKSALIVFSVRGKSIGVGNVSVIINIPELTSVVKDVNIYVGLTPNTLTATSKTSTTSVVKSNYPDTGLMFFTAVTILVLIMGIVMLRMSRRVR